MQDGAGTEQQTVRMLQRGSQLVSVWSPPLSSFQLPASSKLCSLLSSGLCCFKSWVRGVFTSDNNDLGVAYSLKFNFVPSIPFSHRIMWKNKQGSLSEYDIICRQYHFFITKNKFELMFMLLASHLFHLIVWSNSQSAQRSSGITFGYCGFFKSKKWSLLSYFQLKWSSNVEVGISQIHFCFIPS